MDIFGLTLFGFGIVISYSKMNYLDKLTEFEKFFLVYGFTFYFWRFEISVFTPIENNPL